MITFNRPFLTGQEFEFIQDAVNSKKISGNGKYTKLCHEYFEKKYGFKKCLLTTSCTDALEMAAILIDIQPGDEIIIPSYTFVSTANAFVLRGAKIIFADSEDNNPNMDTSKLKSLITKKTKAIVPVHYAGSACDMESIMDIACDNDLFVIEDAAQAIDNYYIGKNDKHRALGSIGHFSTFSFHETKNIIAGEGGMLVINDDNFFERAEIIWEKGTNRSAFFRGEIDKYGWVDIGSSFLPSEIISAFLYAQLNNLDTIQERRKAIWNKYYQTLSKMNLSEKIALPQLSNHSTNNGHLFYITTKNIDTRNNLIAHLKENNINAVFHYQSLHQSSYYASQHDGRKLNNSIFFTNNLIRLPFHMGITDDIIEMISLSISDYFHGN